MQKSIRKPQNWQDFETLCRKLQTTVRIVNDSKHNGKRC